MTSAIEKDCAYSYYSLSICESVKRTLRAYVKTYDNTGTYVFLTLYKRNEVGDMSFSQRISLSLSEFQKISSKIEKIKRLVSKNSRNYKFSPKFKEPDEELKPSTTRKFSGRLKKRAVQSDEEKENLSTTENFNLN